MLARGRADKRKVVVGILKLSVVRVDLVDEKGNGLIFLVALDGPAWDIEGMNLVEEKQGEEGYPPQPNGPNGPLHCCVVPGRTCASYTDNVVANQVTQGVEVVLILRVMLLRGSRGSGSLSSVCSMYRSMYAVMNKRAGYPRESSYSLFEG